MLLFTVGAGKKPGDLAGRRAMRRQAYRFVNDNYLLQNLIK
jgi:hypothetical protein